MNTLFQQCRYVLSAHQLRQLPTDKSVEVAFAGRSNAGKSSAINRICGQKSLAKTSRTPGRTQAINLFSVTENKFIVDLPGYGYAKVGRDIKQRWHTLITEYITSRESLTGLMSIMDIRHPLQQQDWFLIELAFSCPVPIHILLTKCDKLSRNQQQKRLYAVASELEDNGIEVTLQLFSALNGTGIDDAHTILSDWFDIDQ